MSSGLPADWVEQVARAYTVFGVEPADRRNTEFGMKEWLERLHPRDRKGMWREVLGRLTRREQKKRGYLPPAADTASTHRPADAPPTGNPAERSGAPGTYLQRLQDELVPPRADGTGEGISRKELSTRTIKDLEEYLTNRLLESQRKVEQQLRDSGEPEHMDKVLWHKELLREVAASKSEYDEQKQFGGHWKDPAKPHRARLEMIMERFYGSEPLTKEDVERFADTKLLEREYAPITPRIITNEEIRAAMGEALAEIGKEGFGKNANGVTHGDLAAEHLKLLMRVGRLAASAAKQRMMKVDADAAKHDRDPALADDNELLGERAKALEAKYRGLQDTALAANLSLLEDLVGLVGPREGHVKDAVERGNKINERDSFAKASWSNPHPYLDSLTPQEQASVVDAFARLPATWEPEVMRALGPLALVVSQRGHYDSDNSRLAISRNNTHRNIERVAMHEMLHAMEAHLDGLTAAEEAFWEQRVGYDAEVKHDDGGLFPKRPLYKTLREYSLKRYADGMFELLTTGGEDIFGNGASSHLDDQFAAFIWGTFLTLKSK